MRLLGMLGSLLLFAAACGEPQELSEAAQRGRAVWVANCTACHASDPAKAGALGPDVAGSSRELLELRVVRGEYPPGYTPKRSTTAMVALPHLADSIDDLYAFLNEAQP